MLVQVPSKSGGTFSAYLAPLPERPSPAVVVIQEIFGVNANIRAVCDVLAKRQLIAIAPDLYWRAQPNTDLSESDREKAFALRQQTDDNLAADDVAATMDFIKGHPHSTGRVGVVGYCWGGMISYLTALHHKPDAAVSYYGVGIEKHLDEAKNLSCHAMFHYAGKDTFAGPEVAAKVKQTYAGDSRVTVHEYPECGHAFAREGGSNYVLRAADLADMRTLSFFIERLYGPR
jgi:carboxymethylenebutenolidase